jgi:hypothetical protein
MAAGLSLRTGMSAGGSYTPMTPAAANTSTARTISQAAYGVSGTGVSNDSGNVPGYGSVGAGLVCIGLLCWLWFSLPR